MDIIHKKNIVSTYERAKSLLGEDMNFNRRDDFNKGKWLVFSSDGITVGFLLDDFLHVQGLNGGNLDKLAKEIIEFGKMSNKKIRFSVDNVDESKVLERLNSLKIKFHPVGWSNGEQIFEVT